MSSFSLSTNYQKQLQRVVELFNCLLSPVVRVSQTLWLMIIQLWAVEVAAFEAANLPIHRQMHYLSSKGMNSALTSLTRWCQLASFTLPHSFSLRVQYLLAICWLPRAFSFFFFGYACKSCQLVLSQWLHKTETQPKKRATVTSLPEIQLIFHFSFWFGKLASVAITLSCPSLFPFCVLFNLCFCCNVCYTASQRLFPE